MRTTPIVLSLAWVTLLPDPLARAKQDPPRATVESPAAREVRAVRESFQEAKAAFEKAYVAASTAEERQKAFDEIYPKPEDYIPRLWDIVDRYGDDPGVAEALAWIVQLDRGGDSKERALTCLAESFIDSPAVADACATFSRYEPTLTAERFLRKVLEKTPDHATRGRASYALADVLRGQAEQARALQQEKPTRALDEATLEHLRGADPDALEREAIALLEQVAADYDDVESYVGSLADDASADLFELGNLQIGMVAPDIEGEDLDGVAFKLSDYRGKVVMLDFWGDW